MDPLVRDVGLCLLLAGLLTVLFARFRIPTIAALIVAGVLVGPQTPGLVIDRENVSTIASLGLVLLLFLIGLEIDLRKLQASGRTLIVTGLLQFPLCVAFGWGAAALAAWSGWEGIVGRYAPLYIGITAAASSTLIVVRLLQDHYQLDTVVGRVAVGLLILQDIWAIVVLAAQPNFQSPQVGTIAWGFLGIGMLCGIAVLLSRTLIPLALRAIAHSPELVLVAAVGWCFAVGFIGTGLGAAAEAIGFHAPLSVSLEMGALIAGATLAAHPFSHHIVSKVAVVHDFFITLFFVALGAGIPRPDGATMLLLAGFMALVAVLARYVVFLPLLYLTGMDRRHSVIASTRLAQISEFCLVIAYLGQGLGHVDERFVSSVIFAFVATALASPLIFNAGDAIHRGIGPLLRLVGMKAPETGGAAESGEEKPEIALLGFHRVASSLLHELELQHPALVGKTLVVDFNAQLHPAIRRRGARAHYGDLSSFESLRTAGIADAKVAICTVADDLLRGTTNERLVRMLRSMSKEQVIIATSVTMSGVGDLYRAGADFVLLRRLETAKTLTTAIVAAMGGTITDHRLEHEESYGLAEERSEILP
jgi:Kef-type K+ transport system membrane component KefB